MAVFRDPNRPGVVYSGREQDPPGGLNIGNSEALRAMGEIMAGDQGFENTPSSVDREYGGFVRDVGLAGRIATLESKIAAGAEFVDLFNRGDSDSLGSSNPGVVPNWIEFGDGQPMRIIDQAAQLSRDAPFGLVDDGVRYALCPFAATSDDFTVSAIVHPISGPLSRPARTSIYGRCNASGTEGVWVDFYAEACYIGRFTRSGNTMTRSAAWNQNTAKSYSNSSTVELRMTGTRYQVVIDGLTVIDHDDTSGFPVDGNHRYSMFSLMTWTGFLVPPEFSSGLTGFAVRGSSLTAIQQATSTANAAAATANQAAAAADAVLGVAENADAKATNAQSDAAIAYAAAARWKDEFLVSSAGVFLGKNEVDLGVVMDVPPGRVRRISRVVYGLRTNTGQMVVQLVSTSQSRVDSVIHTTTIPAGTVEFIDNSIDVAVTDGHRISCNVTSIGGNSSVLQCALIGALL